MTRNTGIATLLGLFGTSAVSAQGAQPAETPIPFQTGEPRFLVASTTDMVGARHWRPRPNAVATTIRCEKGQR